MNFASLASSSEDESDHETTTSQSTSSFNPNASAYQPPSTSSSFLPPTTTMFSTNNNVNVNATSWHVQPRASGFSRGKPKPKSHTTDSRRRGGGRGGHNNYRSGNGSRGNRGNRRQHHIATKPAAPLPFWTAPPKSHRSVPLTGTPPRLIVLVGMPGSGKSTFTAQLSSHWTTVNQDSIGSRKSCEFAVNKAFGTGKTARVCVDRCNFDRGQRKHWIDLAHKYAIPSHEICAIVLDVPLETAIDRVQQRRNHPTLKPGKESIGIVRKFQYLLKMPSLREGFGMIVTMRPRDDSLMSELVMDWLNDTLQTEEGEGGEEKDDDGDGDDDNDDDDDDDCDVEKEKK